MIVLKYNEMLKGKEEEERRKKRIRWSRKKWWTEKAHIFLTGKLAGVLVYNLFMTQQHVSTSAKDRLMKMPSICKEGQQQRFLEKGNAAFLLTFLKHSVLYKNLAPWDV